MDFLWNGYGLRILKNMDYGMDIDSVLNPSRPTAPRSYKNRLLTILLTDRNAPIRASPVQC